MTSAVFVHGALVRDGDWWWRPTAELLRRGLGVDSAAVRLPSCGEAALPEGRGGLAADAAALRRVLDGLERVVLVGHSYGGTVLAEAGDHPAVVHRVLISSYLPDVGSTQSGLLAGEADPVRVAPGDDGAVGLDGYDERSFAARFLQDADEAVQRAAWARTTRQAASAFTAPTTAAGWRDGDSTYLVCGEDRSTSLDLQRFHAARATRSAVLPTGHHPFVSRPDLVVEQLRPLLA